MSETAQMNAQSFIDAVALEMVKNERDDLQAHVSMLKAELANVTARAERSEARLHEITSAMAVITRQVMLAPPQSTVAEVMIDGKSILRLHNPIAFGA